ncbi:ribosome silencing factor [Thiovibrio frasassiensis]|jgi:ribosome-associated protein|uniref:Ribosomal silencing factor RsfS n=1 Tax=Thiovibrio frasassiensis TaxID=2984131 RepID=A0A9X4MI33_9BACT|nr:ribosome silencing factor [Thiovibrio frasassiensis]MDG4476625.1 ribosome silencing factor [Thiovibrio frasassiensis]
MKKVHKDFQDASSLELARLAALAALDKKAEDLVVLDVRGLSSFTDFFVIMSGRSTRHVQGLSQAVDEALRHKNVKDGNTEGFSEGHWVLLDYNDVIVHIFYSEDRNFYDIEGLWHDAPRVEIAPDPS